MHPELEAEMPGRQIHAGYEKFVTFVCPPVSGYYLGNDKKTEPPIHGCNFFKSWPTLLLKSLLNLVVRLLEHGPPSMSIILCIYCQLVTNYTGSA